MATFTVTNNSDSGAGSLRQALADAAASAGADTIAFQSSMNGQTITLTTGQVSIAHDVTIDGDIDNDGKADVTVSGNNASRIFFITAARTVTLDGLALTGGRAPSGSAIYSTGGETIGITNCAFSDNQANNGGHIHASSATLTITGSSFTSGGANGANARGGAAFLDTCKTTITDSSFAGISAASGGAIYSGGTLALSYLRISGSTLSGNTASNSGGAIYAGVPMTLTNTTISGNSANIAAGGIITAATTTIYNSTIVGNRADADGSDGAIDNGGGIFTNGTLEIFNSVIANNYRGSGTTVQEIVQNNVSQTLNVTNSFFGGSVADVDSNTASPTAETTGDDPLLGALADNGGSVKTHAISSSGSPLVNAGDDSHIPAGTTTDAAGNARTQNGTVDIGAFESNFGAPSSGGNGGSGGGTGGGASPGPSTSATVGTDGADLVAGSNTSQAYDAGAGDDTVQGLAGHDTLYGGLGNDRLEGGADLDMLYGNQGADLLYGNQGSDTLWGGQEEDTLYGGQDADLLLGGQGADRLYGNLSSDILYGNEGSDLLYGNEAADTLYGGQDGDSLYGGAGNDLLLGGQGDDLIFGNLGNDVLSGGAGGDTLAGGGGADLFVFGGEAGADTILDFNAADGDMMQFAAGTTVTVAQTAAGLLLDLGGGATVTLIGAASLDTSSVLFV